MDNSENSISARLNSKLIEFLQRLLKLEPDTNIDADSDLIEEIGLDSIEAFDAVASLHELLNVSIATDFNPKNVNTVRSLGNYVIKQFGEDVARRFVELDLNTAMANVEDEEL